MARSNYQFKKRQKEISRKKKKDEKKQRKLEKKSIETDTETDAINYGEEHFTTFDQGCKDAVESIK